jgi:PEP-CTERM motif
MMKYTQGMKNRKLAAYAGLPLGVLAVFSTAATASTQIVNPASRGAYTSEGVFGTTGSGTPGGNFFTGNLGLEYRSFFGFDLGGVTGTITAASITFGSGAASLDPNLGLFAYTGSYSNLVNGTGGVAAFDDLGSGASYGTVVVSTSDITFTVILDAVALADLNAAEGGDFALGGAVSNWAGGADLFGQTRAETPSYLTLTTAAVPEPSTWAMMALGFAGLGLMGYRSRRAAPSSVSASGLVVAPTLTCDTESSST